MIYSKTTKYSAAKLRNRLVLCDGRRNMAVDLDTSAGVPRMLGLKAPHSAPSLRFTVGAGGLVPGVDYSYAYTHYDSKHDVESPPGPTSEYTSTKQGLYATIFQFGENGDGTSSVIYIQGDFEKDPDFYNGQTIGADIINNEFLSTYDNWQYRVITDYEWSDEKNAGRFTLNRQFFNVDPDVDQQHYQVRIADMGIEEGVVGGVVKDKQKLVLDAGASQTTDYYNMKMIIITSGVGKGQRRWIVDTEVNDTTGQVIITVDKVWKPVPKYVEVDYPESAKNPLVKYALAKGETLEYYKKAKDIYAIREKAEKKGKQRDIKKFYDTYYSSEYVIIDPLANNGLVRKGNIKFYTPTGSEVKKNKANRLTIFGAPRTDLIEGEIINYKDVANGDDVVTINYQPDSIQTPEDNSLAGKRFRIFDGPGSGLDAKIKKSEVVGQFQAVYLDTFGLQMAKKKSKGALGSRFVIYTPVVLSYINDDGTHAVIPPVSGSCTTMENRWLAMGAMATTGEQARKVVIASFLTATGTSAEGYDQYAAELENMDKYNTGKCFIMLSVCHYGGNQQDTVPQEPRYTIMRRVVKCETTFMPTIGGTPPTGTYTCIVLTLDDKFPWHSYSNTENVPTSSGETYSTTQSDYMIPEEGTEYQIYENSLTDGYYVGWKIVFTPEAVTGSKKKPKYMSSRVIAYFDATGEIVLENGVPGVKENCPYVMYSEYTRAIGSRLLLFTEDGVKKKTANGAYTTFASTYNTRFFRLDYFASDTDSYYNFWNLDITYGLAKKTTGSNQAKAKAKAKRQMKCMGYVGKNKRVDVTNGSTDMNIYPVPNGDEFVWLYDPASSIYTIFDEGYLAAENDSVFGQEHMSCTVTDFNAPPCFNSDKIRIYRASESTKVYRYVGQKDNDGVAFEDAVPDEQLGEILSFDNTNIAPAKYVIEHKSRMVYGGGSEKSVSLATAYKDVACCSSIAGTPAGSEVAMDYDCEVKLNIPTTDGSEVNSVKAVLPNLALRIGNVSSTIVHYIDVPVLSRIATTRKILLKFVARFAGSSGTAYCPFVQRYKVLVKGSTQKLQSYLSATSGVKYTGITFSKYTGFPDLGSVDVSVPADDTVLNAGYSTATPYLFLPDFSPDDLVGETVNVISYEGVNGDLKATSVTAFIAYYNADLKIAKLSVSSTDQTAKNIRYRTEQTTTTSGIYYITPSTVEVNKAVWTVYLDGRSGYSGYKLRKSKSFTDETLQSVAFADVNRWVGASLTVAQHTKNTAEMVEDAPHEDDKIRIGMSTHCFQMKYFAIYLDNDEDSVPPYCEYHAGNVNMANTVWSYNLNKNIAVGTLTDLSTKGVTARLYTNTAGATSLMSLLLMPGWFKYDMTGQDTEANGGLVRTSLVLSKPFRGADGNYTGRNITGRTAIQVSTIQDPEFIELSGTFSLEDHNGDEVTGIVSTQKTVAIFKDRAIYQYAPEVPQLQLVTDDMGCIAPRSICAGRSGFYFFTNGNQLHRWDFVNPPQHVGAPLSAWIVGNVQNSVSANLCGDHPFDRTDFENIDVAFDPANNCLLLSVKQSGETVTNRRLLFAYDENKNNWWRVHEAAVNNTVRSLFAYDGTVAMCTGDGIYEVLSAKKVAPWHYSIRWQDYSSTARAKHVKRLVFCNATTEEVSALTTGASVTVTFQKDFDDADIPNVQYADNRTARTFVPTKFSDLVHAGLRSLMWKFKLAGTKYLNLSSIVIMFRPKDESDTSWSQTTP